MDRLDAMRVLLAVVDEGSLSAGGRKLGMPLATVSRKISDLEAALKSRLLTRSTRQLTLTEAGRGYVTACRRILEDVNEADRAAAGEYVAPRGELVVTAPVVFGRLHLLPVVVDFLRTYPEVTVRLALADRIVNLLEDHVDLALRIGALPDSGLVATGLGSIRRVVCASPAYIAERGAPLNPRDLLAHQCVAFEVGDSPAAWMFSVDGAAFAVPIRPRLAVSTAEAAIDAASAGLGLTCLLSYQVEAAVRAGALRLVLESFEPDPIPVSFVYSNQGRLPLKLRALVDFAAGRIRARLEQPTARKPKPDAARPTKRTGAGRR